MAAARRPTRPRIAGPAQATGPIGDVVLEQRFGWKWTLAFAGAVGLVVLFIYAVVVLVAVGVGVWGTNIPFVWGFDIINYVWWIGIANAASLLAAALLLRRTPWRTSINRYAEAVALFAVICAGLFPILHLGRPWLFYWVFPYPTSFGVWPQFRTPLTWDFFAILTHLIATAAFWYTGLIPDLAILRDRARRVWARRIFGVLALGWRGSARHWFHHQTAYHILAGLMLPLVVFMQSTVSLEFAVTLVPDWHQTRLPAWFVISGLMSGLAMVLLVALILRAALRLHAFITPGQIDAMCWLLLASGLVTGYSYAYEAFMSWYGGDAFQQAALIGRATGTFAPIYWGAILCTFGAVQALWFRAVRRSFWMLGAVAVLINIGVWLDRFSIVVIGMCRDYLPSIWRDYQASLWEWALLFGTIGLFLTLMLLFMRFVPVIAMSEIKHVGSPRDHAS